MADNETPPAPAAPANPGGNIASSVLNVANAPGNIGAIRDSVRQGQYMDAAVTTGTTGLSLTRVGTTAASLLGQNTAVMEGVLSKLSAPVTVASNAYSVVRDPRMDRAIGATATTAASLGVPALLSGGLLVEGAAATGGLAVAGAAAPVLVVAGAVYTTSKATELAVATRKIYEDMDHTYQVSSNFHNLRGAEADLSHELKARGARMVGNRRVDLNDENSRTILRQVMAERKSAAQNTANSTDSILPRWVRSGDEAGTNALANLEVQRYTTAEQELANYETTLRQRSEPLQPMMIAATAPNMQNPGITQQNAPPGRVEIPSVPLARATGPAGPIVS